MAAGLLCDALACNGADRARRFRAIELATPLGGERPRRPQGLHRGEAARDRDPFTALKLSDAA